MNQNDGCSNRKPDDVFNTLAKIRAASYRLGFNVWDLFKSLDPNNNRVISVSKFIAVLAGPLKDIIGLHNEEIRALAQYFRQADGRVMYHQFCNLVHGGENVEEKTDVKVSLTEGEIFQRNKLIPEEEKYLLMMLTQIAVVVNRKKMYLKPFFQDYSLVKKGSGLVSRSRLARVLDQVGIHLSSADYNLLLRKYSKDSFTVSYIAFLEDLEEVRKYLEEQGTLDLTGDLLPKFAGRLEGWELPRLPRPEIVEAQEDLVGLPALDRPNYKGLAPKEILDAMNKIRQHLHKQKLLIGPLLERYDKACSGRVTQAQMRLVLAEVSRDCSGLNPLYLTGEEVVGLGKLFADPADGERILWRAFARDIHNDLRDEEKAQWPEKRRKLLQTVCERKVRERQALSWAQMEHPAPPPGSLEDVLLSLKKRTARRNILLKPSFIKYDRAQLGIINRQHLRDALIDNCILCTDEEYSHMENEYIKGGSFNYVDMIQALDKIELPEPSHDAQKPKISNNYIEDMEREKREKAAGRESDIIEVLAKIKGKLICSRTRTRNFMKPLDQSGKGLLSVESFTSTLDQCKLDLSKKELETVLSVFMNKDKSVNYTKFCNTVDEESERPCLTRLPLKEAMARKEGGVKGFDHPFLNYDERRKASVVAKKLSDKISLGQLDAFKTMDVHKTGLVSKSQLMSQLHLMGILHTITMDELDTIIKAFGVIAKGDSSYSIDYLAFLNALDIVYKKYKAANAG